jgi:hypothetical protein
MDFYDLALTNKRKMLSLKCKELTYWVGLWNSIMQLRSAENQKDQVIEMLQICKVEIWEWTMDLLLSMEVTQWDLLDQGPFLCRVKYRHTCSQTITSLQVDSMVVVLLLSLVHLHQWAWCHLPLVLTHTALDTLVATNRLLTVHLLHKATMEALLII